MPSLFHYPYPTGCFYHVPNAMTQEKASHKDRKEELPHSLEHPSPFPESLISPIPSIHPKSSSHYTSCRSYQRWKIPWYGGLILKKPHSSSECIRPSNTWLYLCILPRELFQSKNNRLRSPSVFCIWVLPGFHLHHIPSMIWDFWGLLTFPAIHTHSVMGITWGSFFLFWRCQCIEGKRWKKYRNFHF